MLNVGYHERSDCTFLIARFSIQRSQLTNSKVCKAVSRLEYFGFILPVDHMMKYHTTVFIQSIMEAI